MALANILGHILSGAGFPALEQKSSAEKTGLHFTDPKRFVRSPLFSHVDSPVKLMEGFRSRRYVSSALFSSHRYHCLTSIASSLPVFRCLVREGIPFVTKSPVAIPLTVLRQAGNIELASDGRFIFSLSSRRKCRKMRFVQWQLREVELLESLIEQL